MDYRNAGNEKLRADICKFDFGASDSESFKNTIVCISDKHVPIKREFINASESPFITKELHKAIMKKSKLRNKFLKSKTFFNRKVYTLKRKFCIKLY